MTILRPDHIPPWVPEEMLAELDLTEFADASPAALRERELLSSALDANVAAYPPTAKGRPHGLCSVYRSAHLTAPRFSVYISPSKIFQTCCLSPIASRCSGTMKRLPVEDWKLGGQWKVR